MIVSSIIGLVAAEGVYNLSKSSNCLQVFRSRVYSSSHHFSPYQFALDLFLVIGAVLTSHFSLLVGSKLLKVSHPFFSSSTRVFALFLGRYSQSIPFFVTITTHAHLRGQLTILIKKISEVIEKMNQARAYFQSVVLNPSQIVHQAEQHYQRVCAAFCDIIETEIPSEVIEIEKDYESFNKHMRRRSELISKVTVKLRDSKAQAEKLKAELSKKIEELKQENDNLDQVICPFEDLEYRMIARVVEKFGKVDKLKSIREKNSNSISQLTHLIGQIKCVEEAIEMLKGADSYEKSTYIEWQVMANASISEATTLNLLKVELTSNLISWVGSIIFGSENKGSELDQAAIQKMLKSNLARKIPPLMRALKKSINLTQEVRSRSVRFLSKDHPLNVPQESCCKAWTIERLLLKRSLIYLHEAKITFFSTIKLPKEFKAEEEVIKLKNLIRKIEKEYLAGFQKLSLIEQEEISLTERSLR